VKRASIDHPIGALSGILTRLVVIFFDDDDNDCSAALTIVVAVVMMVVMVTTAVLVMMRFVVVMPTAAGDLFEFLIVQFKGAILRVEEIVVHCEFSFLLCAL